jgi:hypothetical protein
MSESLNNTSSEQIHYGDYTQNGKEYPKDPENILARSSVTMDRKEVKIQTTTPQKAVTFIYDNPNNPVTRRHDAIDHTIGISTMYAAGTPEYSSASPSEESLAVISSHIRKDKYPHTPDDTTLNRSIKDSNENIENYQRQITAIKENYDDGEIFNTQDQKTVDKLKDLIEQITDIRDKNSLIINEGRDSGLGELRDNLKNAEFFVDRVIPNVMSGDLKFTIENIVTQKPNIPDETVRILTNLSKRSRL